MACKADTAPVPTAASAAPPSATPKGRSRRPTLPIVTSPRHLGGPVSKDASCVIAGELYLGNKISAADTTWLKEAGIKSILNVADDNTAIPKETYDELGIESRQIACADTIEFNISEIFEDATKWLEAAPRPTLVHCRAGVSRSAAVVIAYMMKTRGMTFGTAYRMVREARWQVLPNKGFLTQLITYSKQLYGKADIPADLVTDIQDDLEHLNVR